MDKKPKTKEVVRTVKEHAASAAKEKAAQVGVKTKEAVAGKVEDQFKPQQNKKGEQSAESYASDQVTEKAEQLADESVHLTGKAVKSTVYTVREKRKEKKNAEAEETPEADLSDPSENTSATDDNPKPSENKPKESSKTNEPPPRTSESTEVGSASSKNNPQSSEPKKGVEHTSDVQKPSETKASSDKKKPSRTDAVDHSAAGAPSETTEMKVPDTPQANGQKPPAQSGQKTICSKTPEQAAIKERTLAKPKNAFGSDVPERETKPRTRQKSLPKQRGQQTIKHAGARANEIRTASAASHKVKEVQHGTAQTIKTADKAVKNAERTAKATKKAAETTAKAAKRSEEAARRTAKAAIQATKVAVKAAVEGIKAAIAAGKELIAAIGAGGPVVLVIIIVICLISAIGGTCFGIFLSNDKTTGTQITMTEAITQLTSEHYNQLTNTKSNYTYDMMEVDSASGGISIDWRDVLAVYAVKTTTSTENAYEVVTMDDVKMDLLRQVINDMNQISYAVEQRQVTETVTEKNSNGNTVTTTKTVTKNVLKVTVTRLTAEQITLQYHFNEEQKKQLNELMGSDYDDLWTELIGTAGATGDVLMSESTYIPTDIFAWPLQQNWSISSPFGYRTDPISGEHKLHGGTDIAAPTGTPILASADGVVIAATWHNSYGYYVKIQHNDTFATLYGHCSALHVTAGQQVKQGQIIADVGSTGYATGPHVHFEVYINGTRVDAMQYFR